nr:MAG TPA: hypothetical protein [Caudoviricetes sp.]
MSPVRRVGLTYDIFISSSFSKFTCVSTSCLTNGEKSS